MINGAKEPGEAKTPEAGVRLVNRIVRAIKMFELMLVNRLTDGEICFQIYHIFMNVL